MLRALGFGLDSANLVFRADEPELGNARGPLGQESGGPGRAGVLVVALEQDAQALGRIGVELLGAGHPRADVPSERTKDHDRAVRHVLARVATDAFNDRGCTRVANGEALARRACEKELAAGRPVENRVAGEAWITRIVGRRPDHDAASAQALADVIVGLAVEDELDARRQEGAEALSCRSFEAVVE